MFLDRIMGIVFYSGQSGQVSVAKAYSELKENLKNADSQTSQ